MKERRRFPRYDCSYRVKYSTQGMASVESTSIADNISRVGMRVPVSRLVKNGDTLRLDIFTHTEESPVSANGLVRWTRHNRLNQDHTVDAGIEFVEIEPLDIDKLLSIK